MKKDYDVIILGGGLAGLTLAMQIKQQKPAISILILEIRKKEAALAAHKVGESTVELGTHYLREVLNLKDYLEKNHLHKHGLRFYFSPEVKETIDQRVEYGAKNELFVPSHQIDRGLFENDLVKMVTDLGVDIQLGARVTDVDLNEEGHTVKYIQNGEDNIHTSNWVIDAAGRASFLKRKEGLIEDTEHDINSVWFRVQGEIDISQMSSNETWQEYINPGLRRLGTVHFMGKGYWVWFIPLSSGNTSIGIVADPRFHDFTSMNTLEKAYTWLEKNEPLCYKHLIDKKGNVLDFKKLKNFSYGTSKFYSTDKWAVVGEAGAFLDPFYSPGTDFISLANTWVSDLIIRDFDGEDIYTRTMTYDQVHARLFENWIPVYLNKYELFDNAQVMCVKITWDFAVYWAIPSLLFTNKGLINMKVLKAIFTTKNSFGERFGKLNKQVQDFYLDWGRRENEQYSNSYIDPMSVPYLKDLQKGLEMIHDSEEILINKLEENLLFLEKMAAELFRIVCKRLNSTPTHMPVNPYIMSLVLSREELIDQGESKDALPFNQDVFDNISSLWLK